jgi:DNA-binding IscR family transcriptional regulator
MSVKSVQFAVATHVMAALGVYPGGEIASATLADSVRANPTFVRKSLSKLSKAGLVVTTRGKNGASVLARPPTDHAIRYIPCQRSTAGVCHPFLSDRKEVSGQL